MGERWDNFLEEIAWPYIQAKRWYESGDNRWATWALIISTAVLALITYGSLFFGGRAIIRAVSNDTTITVVAGNPCINAKGLVKAFAPAICYEDKNPHPVINPTTREESRLPSMTIRNNDATISSPNDVAYNPPCKKDGLPGCSDSIYGKRLLSGTVYVTNLHNDERLTVDGHLQPDYTEVEVDPCNGDSCENVKEKFCGDVLDWFVPGKRIHVVLNESKQADYNGCYTVEIVTYTFGGDKYARRGR